MRCNTPHPFRLLFVRKKLLLSVAMLKYAVRLLQIVRDFTAEAHGVE
jgi:hypothetical protein